jgi:hypothetical protein
MNRKTLMLLVLLIAILSATIVYAIVMDKQIYNTGRIVSNINLQVSIDTIDWGELQIGQSYNSSEFTVSNMGVSAGYVWWNASVPEGLTLTLYNYGELWNQNSKKPLGSNTSDVVYARLTVSPNANLGNFTFDINFFLSDSL